MRLAATEYDRVVTLLRAMPAEGWARPTDCPGWDAHALTAHLLGMAEMAATMREQLRQTRKAKKAGGNFLDALTALQVEERKQLSPAQLIERYAEVGPRAAKARRRVPGFLRKRPMPDPQAAGGKPDSPRETWALGYLIDVILTRDPWMHRTELAAAAGSPMLLTPDHDGVIVADVVAEWADRHGQPCTLVISGPAGGRWSFGSGGPSIEMDAVEFCRILSGRGPASGLLTTEVPF